MQCLFLLRAGNACYCEVVSDHREHWRALLSSWVCRNAWEELCPRYRGLIKKAGDPPQPLFDHSETVHTQQNRRLSGDSAGSPVKSKGLSRRGGTRLLRDLSLLH